jgi:hypothetical protein
VASRDVPVLVRCIRDEEDVEVVKSVSHTAAHPELSGVATHGHGTAGSGATRLASLNRLTSATGAPRWEALPTGAGEVYQCNPSRHG